MACPHQTKLTPTAIRCACLPHLRGIAGPANPNYPCDRCRAEWPADVPPDPDDRSTWTPTLLSFVEPLSNAEQLPAKPRGLGDTIALGLQALGIRKRKGCGCGKRQAWLNRLVPYAD